MANNMREIKLRIKSINQMRQITKAMKLISASKLKKARAQLDETLPYFNKVRETIAEILAHSGDVESKYFDIRDDKPGSKKAYIVITGDKGLAGGYNSNIKKLAEQAVSQDKENALLLIAGNSGKSYFVKKNYHVHTEFDYAVQNPTVFRAREIADIILELYNKKQVDEVYIIFTQMLSAITLEPKMLKLLPLEIGALRDDVNAEDIKIDEQIKYEPSPSVVLDVLIQKYIKGIIYGAFVEAFTSEQNARMTAMDSATKNADEMLQKLNLYYNRARQAAITQEISEIVGGAAALK